MRPFTHYLLVNHRKILRCFERREDAIDYWRELRASNPVVKGQLRLVKVEGVTEGVEG